MFISLHLKAYIHNLNKNGPVVSEKSKFNFLCVNDSGPRSGNDIDLAYPHTFIYSISSFRSQAAILSEKSIVFTFSYRKAYVTQFDIVVKQVVNPGLSF